MKLIFIIYNMNDSNQENIDHSDQKEQYKQNTQNDLYAILEVSLDSSQEEIKSKYNELLLLHHPDKGGDAQKFKDLKIAYKILSNPKNREIYTKSLSSTFIDITKEYRDANTGKYCDIGYEINLEDFTRGSNEDKKDKRQQFMKKFDENRNENEKRLFDDLQQSSKFALRFDELLKQREKLDCEIDIPIIDGLDPQKLNLDLFNQIFEANKNRQAVDLEPLSNPQATGRCGLMPIDSQFGNSLFADDPWMNYQNRKDFHTYQQPTNVSISEFDHNINVTRTRENNPDNLNDLMIQLMEEQMKERNKLLFMDKEEYMIDYEHDPKNNPLSYYNMLGINEDFSQLTIDPPKMKNGEKLK